MRNFHSNDRFKVINGSILSLATLIFGCSRVSQNSPVLLDSYPCLDSLSLLLRPPSQYMALWAVLEVVMDAFLKQIAQPAVSKTVEIPRRQVATELVDSDLEDQFGFLDGNCRKRRRQKW